MSSSTTSSDRLDVGALRQAIEARDANALAALYAPDAEIVLVDQEHSPSQPQRAQGIDAIRGVLQDIYSRDMTHEVRQLVDGPDGVAFTVDCRYPDGTHVLANTLLEVRDGHIARQQDVVAWDTA
ncbi:MAG: hypothetical protein JWQ48_2334 [Conexibacter sp.]|jgi:ketosteroid isomerase-like protein|nr:hypothetical protein [Conexibacter sp.]